VGVLDAFMSTWSTARETFGNGVPPNGAQYARSGPLRGLQVDVRSAAPGSTWSGCAASAYKAANSLHGRVFGRLAELDHRLGERIAQSSLVVTDGRRHLDDVRKWVVDAAASVPQGKNRERMLMPIVQTGLSQVSEIVARSNGDLSAIGGQIRAIGNEYQALGNQKFGAIGVRAVGNMAAAGPFDMPDEVEVRRNPLTPGRSANPADPFVGNLNFGQWETFSTSPNGPYAPLMDQYRPFDDNPPIKTGPSTGMYVPGKTWLADADAPILQHRESYRFRIAGTDATDITRVVKVNGETQVQRWVANVYQYQRNTSNSLGGSLEGLPPLQFFDQAWKRISLPQVAALSATNEDITYYLPDGCGGSVDFVGGLAHSKNVAPQIPIMTRPR
jgi:hypothetical protein